MQIWASADGHFEGQEWGRDTFISIRGLLLERGKFEEAKAIIRRFAQYEHNGLIS